jgi:A/G-specific adenine glycosylase
LNTFYSFLPPSVGKLFVSSLFGNRQKTYFQPMNFSSSLLAWYRKNKRDLPWRNTKNPYHIWLSEIIMQQTRVEQGTPYYKAFLKNYPTVTHLAKAPIDDVLKLWQGLGYYSRARNLHKAAQTIFSERAGKFPEVYEDIRSLKGVGEYTAAAIASFAYNKPYAVVDGNVFRVLSRVFGITTPIDSTTGKKEFRELAAALLDQQDPATYNQAIMEFGARYCKPNNPDCEGCIFTHSCIAREKKIVDKLPVKAKKLKVRNRYFQYLVIRYKNSTWLKKRTGKDIWEGLFDFPLIESEKSLTETELKKDPAWKKDIGKLEPRIKSASGEYKHLLSHQQIFATFWELTVGKKPEIQGWTEIEIGKIYTYAVPRLVDRFLESGPESLY